MENPNKSICVDVVYAPSVMEQTVITVNVIANTTVREAIEQSGLLTRYPELDLNNQKIGVFSRSVALDKEVKAGDRIELYRPLRVDPKAARRQRAKLGE